jgi:hypothetical protein
MREETLAWIREEGERSARENAIDLCAKCPHVKSERREERTVFNGLRLSVFVAHCHHPSADCTARVQSHLISETAQVANRIVQHLVELPDMAKAGVSWLACFAPEADRLILTYRIHQMELVLVALGKLRIEEFLRDPVGPPCQDCVQPIPMDRVNSLPHAIRCLTCQIEHELQVG